jgi:1-acyl-sn-glycerol-3-phosphate acyltransferase/nucleoside-diphosphate-sugar epimerase
MAKITLVGSNRNSLVNGLWDALPEMPGAHEFILGEPDHAADTVSPDMMYVYVPTPADRDGMTPDLREAERLFAGIQPQTKKFVVISSALVYGTGPGRQALVDEGYSAPGEQDRISHQWSRLEALAERYLQGRTCLMILRPSLVLPSPALPARVLSKRLVPTLPGHDPVVQLLSPTDLAAAVLCAIAADKPGTYNVAPDNTIPLHRAIRLARCRRIAVPRTLRRMMRRSESLDYLRYPWTVSNQRIKRELGFVPRKSSLAALTELHDRKSLPPDVEPQVDDVGMDPDYIRFYSQTLFRLVSDFYWRIETQGLEYIPRRGRALLVGMHRGFMPFDGVMALHTVVRKTGRIPRFLTHPALLKFPFLANFMTKLGGVVACQDSADRVLAGDELLGIYPEGIQGAFTLYRDAYRLHAFGRDAFVKLALRHRAPIVPFVTVGSAEIFPIFGKIRSRRWTRYAGWPFIPITPTFPILPVPLPSKWHTQFLPTIQVDQYPPEAADDPAVVKAISSEVRTRMQCAVDDMRSRRKSIFFGSVFEARPSESHNKPAPAR